jgi:hypothetical protein
MSRSHRDGATDVLRPNVLLTAPHKVLSVYEKKIAGTSTDFLSGRAFVVAVGGRTCRSVAAGTLILVPRALTAHAIIAVVSVKVEVESVSSVAIEG